MLHVSLKPSLLQNQHKNNQNIDTLSAGASTNGNCTRAVENMDKSCVILTCHRPKRRRFPIYQSHLRLASRTCTQVRPWADRIKSIPCGIFSKSQICATFLKDQVNIFEKESVGRRKPHLIDLHISILQNMDQKEEKKENKIDNSFFCLAAPLKQTS